MSDQAPGSLMVEAAEAGVRIIERKETSMEVLLGLAAIISVVVFGQATGLTRGSPASRAERLRELDREEEFSRRIGRVEEGLECGYPYCDCAWRGDCGLPNEGDLFAPARGEYPLYATVRFGAGLAQRDSI